MPTTNKRETKPCVVMRHASLILNPSQTKQILSPHLHTVVLSVAFENKREAEREEKRKRKGREGK
jgi:hypothetical protein